MTASPLVITGVGVDRASEDAHAGGDQPYSWRLYSPLCRRHPPWGWATAHASQLSAGSVHGLGGLGRGPLKVGGDSDEVGVRHGVAGRGE